MSDEQLEVPETLSEGNEWYEENPNMFTANIRSWTTLCGLLGKVEIDHTPDRPQIPGRPWVVTFKWHGGSGCFESAVEAVAHIRKTAGEGAVRTLMYAGVDVPEQLEKYI